MSTARSWRGPQNLMLRSWSNTLVSVRQVAQRNAGRATAGIDGRVTLTSPARMNLAEQAHRAARSFMPLAVKRVYIPKANGKQRPLGIPMGPHIPRSAFYLARPFLQNSRTRKWRSLDARALYRMTVAASEHYNTAFQAALSARLGVTWQPRAAPGGKEPVYEVAGVPDAFLAHFSRRRAAIESRYAELLAQYRAEHGHEAPTAVAHKLARQGEPRYPAGQEAAPITGRDAHRLDGATDCGVRRRVARQATSRCARPSRRGGTAQSPSRHGCGRPTGRR